MSVMDVKGGTQAWANTKGGPSTDVQKYDKTEALSAADKEKYYDGKDIGEVLNKLSDPNYTDPAKKVRAVGNNQLDKDAFLKLLLAQMKNQDPTNPLKSHEMAAQLAQFTSLEKLTNIDQSIDGLRKDQAPMQNYESLNLIGKAVSGDSSKISRTPDSDAHSIRFNLGQDSQKAKVEIKNAAGEVVRTLDAPMLKQGRNEISWNGVLEDGSKATPGDYTVVVEAIGNSGKKVAVETRFEGIIDGVQFTPQGPMLTIGKQQLRMSDVSKIVDPSLIQQMRAAPQQAVPQGMLPVQGANKKPETELKPENKKKGTAGAPSSLEDVAMNRGLINKLNKDGTKINTGG